ncbi:MAG: ABC transporter ATP-binding protein [Chthoniobacterales bacterium]
MSQTSYAVSIENLTKVYPVPFRKTRIVAVNDLNLTVHAGEVYGLIGPNGSGKSTTMKVILGLVTPTVGTAQIFGKDVTDVGSREQVGFLPENPYFYKFLTGEETLRFYGKLCGLSGAKLRSRVDELLALVGLEDARERRIGGYSKGMLQRIGLAQALVQEPRLVVLDEPTAGVDPVGSRQIRDMIFSLKQRGITVFLTSHLLEQVQEVCDRVGILARGKLVREGRLDELISIADQTEVIIENPTAELLEKIQKVIKESNANLVAIRKPQTTLESVFLDATGPTDKK